MFPKGRRNVPTIKRIAANETYMRGVISTVLSNYETSLKKKKEIPKFTGGIWDCDDMDIAEVKHDLTDATKHEEAYKGRSKLLTNQAAEAYHFFSTPEASSKNTEEKENTCSLALSNKNKEYLSSNGDTSEKSFVVSESSHLSTSPSLTRKRYLSSESSLAFDAMDNDFEVTKKSLVNLSTLESGAFFMKEYDSDFDFFRHKDDDSDLNKLDAKLMKKKDNFKEVRKRVKLQPRTSFSCIDKAFSEKGKTEFNLHNDSSFTDQAKHFDLVLPKEGDNVKLVPSFINTVTNVEQQILPLKAEDIKILTVNSDLSYTFPMLHDECANQHVNNVEVQSVTAYQQEIDDLIRIIKVFESLRDQSERTNSSFTSEIQSLKRICSVLERFECGENSQGFNNLKLLPNTGGQHKNDANIQLYSAACNTLEAKVSNSHVDSSSCSIVILDDQSNSNDKILNIMQKSNVMDSIDETSQHKAKKVAFPLQVMNTKQHNHELVFNTGNIPVFESINKNTESITHCVAGGSNQFNSITSQSKMQNQMFNQTQSMHKMKTAFEISAINNTPRNCKNPHQQQNANRNLTDRRTQIGKELANQQNSKVNSIKINHANLNHNLEVKPQKEVTSWRSQNHVPDWRPNKELQRWFDSTLISDSHKLESCFDDMMNLNVFEANGQKVDDLMIPYESIIQAQKRFPSFSDLVPYPDMAAKRLEWNAQSIVVILRFMFSISYSLPSWEITLEIYSISKKFKLEKLQDSCLEYFNNQPIDKPQKVVQLATYLKVVDALRKSKMFSKLKIATDFSADFSFPAQSCYVLCRTCSEPLDFIIPLISQKKALKRSDLSCAKQCDVKNELLIETNSEICVITGIQMKFDADAKDFGKDLNIFYDAFINEKKIFGEEQEKKLKQIIIIIFDEKLVLKPKEKGKLYIEIEDICLGFCYLASQDKVNNGDFCFTLTSNKKSMHKPLFLIEKVFYTVQSKRF